MRPPRLRTRPPVKQDAIVDHLRGLIVRGELAPGARLPPRARLEDEFGVATMTVQRAFERMVDDGFVTVAGSQGSFVSAAPPHLHRQVLVLPSRPGDANWVGFWSMLAGEARRVGATPARRIAIAEAIDPSHADPGIDGLVADLAAHRVAGLIFASDPWYLAGSPLLTAPGVPRVAFSGPRSTTGVPGVCLGGDGHEFLATAIAFLARRGRRRIALLNVPGLSGRIPEAFRSGLQAAGLDYCPSREQVAPQHQPSWAAHLMLLMFGAPAGQRPDALIIADDNLVDHACEGLLRLGLGVPGEVDVVAHANYPLAAPARLPVTRLGYDIPEAFVACLDLLERQRRGEAVPPLTVIAPRFAAPGSATPTQLETP